MSPRCRFVPRSRMRSWQGNSLRLFTLLLLLIALLPAPTAFSARCSQYHTVRRGETLLGIANRYNVSWQSLVELNELDDPNRIFAGQSLCITALGPLIPGTGGDQEESDPLIEAIGGREDEWVELLGTDVPANDTFEIRMGEQENFARQNGIWAGSIQSGDQGTFQGVFPIPRQLRGLDRIYVRTDGLSSRLISYTWFYNLNFSSNPSGPGIPLPEQDSAAVLSYWVWSGQEADVHQGTAGLMLPASRYEGWVWLYGYDSEQAPSPGALDFSQDLLEVQIKDRQGRSLTSVQGVNYVYFDLSRAERNDYRDGDITIYHFNPARRQWEACQDTVLLPNPNGSYGRLACVIEEFGLYGLAR